MQTVAFKNDYCSFNAGPQAGDVCDVIQEHSADPGDVMYTFKRVWNLLESFQ